MSALAALVVAVVYVLLRQRNGPDLIVQTDDGWQPDVRVAINGEVASPGAYVLHGDARLADLVGAAGGYTDRAARDTLNPAARVGDGQQYTVPTQSPRTATAGSRAETATAAPAVVSMAPATPAASTTPPRTMPPAAMGKININTATKDELEALPAIGVALAERIIADRMANGPYTQIEDLARVRGISPRTVDMLRDRITVGS